MSTSFTFSAPTKKTSGSKLLSNALLALCLLLSFGYTSTAYSAISIITEAKWTVFETNSFRIHYTAEYRDWAISAAHDMEAAAKTVKEHQDRDLKMKVDVVVFDPFNDSNGFAIPFSNKPIMALFATPPQSDSIISNSSSWQQLLSLHEYVHLVHIGQPTRQSFKQSLSKYWDLYDIYKSSGMPRWVTEGYATLLESKFTGRGRLFDVQVEAMLLQFAREGALPKYNELSNTSGRYQIGSMAYLVGVRYLSWLEKNYSDKTLDAVWTRLRGKKSRSFNDAFKGVFLETPEYLYQRFVAEFTFNALAMQKQLEQTKPNNSSIWLNAEYDMTAPALSPSNKYLAVIESDEDKSIVLNVYQTADNKEAQDDFEKEKVELLENDPVDIGDNAPSVFKRKVEHTLQQTNFSGIRNPRWLDDDHILYGAKTIDSNGMQHQDLFKWQLSTGDVSQLTRHANLRRFDVTPSGKVIAEQTRGGYSGLVSFELSQIDGPTLGEAELTKLSEFSLAHIYDFPRINPSDATQLAYLKSTHNQPWSLYITSLSNGTDSALKAMQVNMPKGYQFLSFPEWADDGKSLYFVAGVKDTLKVYEFTLATGQLVAVTHGQTTVSWPIELVQKPETDPDTNQEQQETTSLLNISVQSRGPDIFTQPLMAKHFTVVTEFADIKNLSTASNNSDSPILMPAAKLSSDTSIGKEYDYHVKDQDITFIWVGSESSASVGTSELGIKGSDLLQKINWDISFLAGGRGGLTNAVAGNFTFSSLPIKFSAHVYDFELDASKQQDSSATASESYTGYRLAANYPYLFTHGLLATYKGDLTVAVNVQEQSFSESTISEISHQQSWYLDKQTWGLTQSSSFTYLEGETDISAATEDTTEQWTGSQGELSLGAHFYGIKLTVSGQFAKRNDSSLNLLSLGGVETNIINAKAHSNWVFTPELPFYFQSGNDYKNTTVSLNGRQSTWELYYSAPEMDDVNRAKIIGFKDSISLDMFRSGITNLEVKYGIADVQLDEENHKVQAWLQGIYRF